jgi:DNA-binding NarL/FixJ family response regulator
MSRMTTEANELRPVMAALTKAAAEKPIRIILADGDPNFVNSLKDYLIAQPNFSVVARVETCLDALIWCEELKPEILILDWHLMFEGLLPNEMKGHTFLQKVKALQPAPAVIVAARLSLDEHRNAALAAGADEFMPKTKFPQLIRPLIRRLTVAN